MAFRLQRSRSNLSTAARLMDLIDKDLDSVEEFYQRYDNILDTIQLSLRDGLTDIYYVRTHCEDSLAFVS